MKKICCSCKQEKNLNDFRRDAARPDGRQPYCKICARERQRSTYTVRYRAKTLERDRLNRDTNRQLLLDYKEKHPCVCCGEKEPVCLDFHHIDPNTKKFNVGLDVQRRWGQMLEEIQKCVVVCANCHRKIHAGILHVNDQMQHCGMNTHP